MAFDVKALEVPYQNAVVEKGGLLTQVWQQFFRNLFDRLKSRM